LRTSRGLKDMMNPCADRRRFLACVAGLPPLSVSALHGLWADVAAQQAPQITREMLADAVRVAGESFSDAELDAIVERVNANLALYADLHRVPLDNSVAPPLYFNPIVPGMAIDRVARPPRPTRQRVARPGGAEDIAYLPVTALAELLRTRQLTSAELTRIYLDRLARYGPRLQCVVTLTEERALRQAAQADAEIASGRYRGPLHGIPWGVKDLFATRGYPTSWGAAPFKARVLDVDATVVARLDAAGAVLVAKLATGELAIDDVWFGGQTKNPWDLSMGSQGSSAGPAAATAAGLVAFAIGTETLGSIVEPSGICGVTGLRPTFGRVSRHGVMALSWTLDKIGPICRSAEDCALVLAAIHGPDDQDLSVQAVPFNWDAGADVRCLRVGYLKAAFEKTRQTPQTDANDARALETLRRLGITPVEVRLPEGPAVPTIAILYAESNAALKDPVRTSPGQLVRKDRTAWQNSFRLFPASDYLDANRARAILMREMARVMSDVDVYVTPFDYADYTPNPIATLNTSITNLTGQPCVVVPHGLNEKGRPTSLTFVGRVFGESTMLAAAHAFQQATEWHLARPGL
jgi:Asp-tRNA(Asn)/Glu-tRNA(Gln) amidotransferase A subunit family amidase